MLYCTRWCNYKALHTMGCTYTAVVAFLYSTTVGVMQRADASALHLQGHWRELTTSILRHFSLACMLRTP